tara:strand:+ start:119 stop:334 length:216 start_codon:yes stop_codon:yes gene_type:complete
MQKSYAENNNLIEEESIYNSLNYHTNSILIEVVDPPIYRGFMEYLLFILKILFIGTILIGLFYGIIYLFSN